MDNLFQYLIWGIIIFSLLSSFLKKKEPPKQNPASRRSENGSAESMDTVKENAGTASTTSAQGSDDYDILRELENIFKGKVDVPQSKSPAPVQPRDYAEKEIKEVNLDKSSDARMQRRIEDRRPVDTKSNLDRKTALEQQNWTRKKVYVDPKVEATAAEFERVLAGPKKQRAAITEFNRKLKNPATVKEYILFSEILGKPKALRR